MTNAEIVFACFIVYILLSTLLSILYLRRFLMVRSLNQKLLNLLLVQPSLNDVPESMKIAGSDLSETTEKIEDLFVYRSEKLADYTTRFSDQISIEEQLEAAKFKALQSAKSLQAEIGNLQSQRSELIQKIEEEQKKFQSLKSELIELKDEHELYLDGYKAPEFDIGDHQSLVFEVKKLRQQQKDMIRRKEAVKCSIDWIIGDSKREGKKAINRLIRLTLRAFNNEADLLISKTTWKNAEATKDKIRRVSENLDDLNESMQIKIDKQYLRLKIDEVNLVAAEKSKKEEEKELLREQRERERQEAKVQREIRAEVAKQEKLENEKIKALEAAKERLAIASDEHRDALEKEIAVYKEELSEAIVAKGRLLSMAEHTKIGHVYIISNRGSFGENMVKIGMTRRLEPMDRVKELGDASVPFPFDVHALVFSENAPKLEKELHDLFAPSRVNKVNNRKEFFNLNLNELAEVMHTKFPELPFVMGTPSIQYIESTSN